MKTNWVRCPICDEPDMRKTTDDDGHSLIECVNHACQSNGGEYRCDKRIIINLNLFDEDHWPRYRALIAKDNHCSIEDVAYPVCLSAIRQLVKI